MANDNLKRAKVLTQEEPGSQKTTDLANLRRLSLRGPQTQSTYSHNEITTAEAMRMDRSGSVVPGILTTGSGFLPGGKPVVDAINVVDDIKKTNQLGVSGGGFGALGDADIFLEEVTSERESFFGKIGKGFSWIFSKISNFFSSLIPGGSFVSGGVQVGLEMGSQSFENAEKGRYRELTGQKLIFADRDDLEEIFHTDQEEILNAIASVLDVNSDGRVDELELSTARTLLDQDRSGNVSAEEIQAHGGLQGAMAYLNQHHKDAIDLVEYDETFGRYNLLETLGRSSETRETIGNRFMELDKNKDGTVSRDEYREALAGLDTNGDRIIDRKERNAVQDDPNSAFNLMVQRLNNSGRG